MNKLSRKRRKHDLQLGVEGGRTIVNSIFSCSFLLSASFFLIVLYQIRKFSPKQTFSMISQTSIIIFPSPVTNKKNNDLVSNIPVVQNQILTLMFLRFFFRVISFLNAKKNLKKTLTTPPVINFLFIHYEQNWDLIKQKNTENGIFVIAVLLLPFEIKLCLLSFFSWLNWILFSRNNIVTYFTFLSCLLQKARILDKMTILRHWKNLQLKTYLSKRYSCQNIYFSVCFGIYKIQVLWAKYTHIFY